MSFWLLAFSRTGPARYLSHLDTARAIQRTFARAGVPIALSEGMRPKPRLSLPLPLPVGAAGRNELAVIEVPADAPDPATALPELGAAAPPGLRPAAIAVVMEGHPRPQPFEAEYDCLLDGPAGAIAQAVERYGSEDEVIRTRVSPKGTRELDLKKYIVDAGVAPASGGGAQLRFTVRYRRDGAARPQEFVDLIAEWAGVESAMRGLERRCVRWQGSPAGMSPWVGRSVAS